MQTTIDFLKNKEDLPDFIMTIGKK